jgi:uncharacterized protein HemX
MYIGKTAYDSNLTKSTATATIDKKVLLEPTKQTLDRDVTTSEPRTPSNYNVVQQSVGQQTQDTQSSPTPAPQESYSGGSFGGGSFGSESIEQNEEDATSDNVPTGGGVEEKKEETKKGWKGYLILALILGAVGYYFWKKYNKK